MEIVKTMIDGRSGFSNSETREAEERAVAYINERWKRFGLELVFYAGRFNPVDGYVWDGSRVSAIFEFKSRPRFSGDVFTLSHRKYFWLLITALAAKGSGLLIVETALGYFVIDVTRINISQQVRSMYGADVRHRSNDMEPGIKLSMQDFKKI